MKTVMFEGEAKLGGDDSCCYGMHMQLFDGQSERTIQYPLYQREKLVAQGHSGTYQVAIWTRIHDLIGWLDENIEEGKRVRVTLTVEEL